MAGRVRAWWGGGQGQVAGLVEWLAWWDHWDGGQGGQKGMDLWRCSGVKDSTTYIEYWT